MLAVAEKRGRYTELVNRDIVDTMRDETRRYGLVIAADVFVYVGRLGEVMPAVYDVLLDDGLLVFSTEKSPDADCKLQATGRYAHSQEYIREVAGSAGFTEVTCRDIPLRMEAGKAIDGNLYVFRKQPRRN